MFRTRVNGAAKRDQFCSSQHSLDDDDVCILLFRVILESMFCHYTTQLLLLLPFVVCCLLLSVVVVVLVVVVVVVVVVVPLCACAFVHFSCVSVWWVLCGVPLCRCFVLCRVVSSSLSSGAFVVVCRCLFVSVV